MKSRLKTKEKWSENPKKNVFQRKEIEKEKKELLKRKKEHEGKKSKHMKKVFKKKCREKTWRK